MFTVKAEVTAGCSLQTDPLSEQGVAGIFIVDLSVFRPFLPIPSPPPRQPIAGTLPALERTPAGPLIPPRQDQPCQCHSRQMCVQPVLKNTVLHPAQTVYSGL